MRPNAATIAAILCIAALPARAAGSWTPGQRLSDPGVVYAGSSAAIDPHGDAVAIWVDQRSINGSGAPDRLLARTRAPGAAFGASTTVAVLDITGDIYDPHVYMTESGFATALWFDGYHVRYNDRPLGGRWTATQNVTPQTTTSDGFSSAYAIAADHVGDLAVRVNDEVFIRPKGSQWYSVGHPLDPAKYPNIQPTGAVLISPSGDVAAFLTTYDVVCSPPTSHHCRKVNLTLRLSRLRPGSTTWQVAGSADLANGDAYVLDDQGRLVFATQTGSAVSVTTQPKFGAPIVTVTTLSTAGTVIGIGADAAGTGTVLIAETASNQSVTFTGPLGGGTGWTRQFVAATSNAVPATQFKVSASGSATFVWQPSATADSPVDAVTRASNTAPWSAATQLSAAIPRYDVDWFAVAANNQAITTWTSVNTAVAGNVSIHNP